MLIDVKSNKHEVCVLYYVNGMNWQLSLPVLTIILCQFWCTLIQIYKVFFVKLQIRRISMNAKLYETILIFISSQNEKNSLQFANRWILKNFCTKYWNADQCVNCGSPSLQLRQSSAVVEWVKRKRIPLKTIFLKIYEPFDLNMHASCQANLSLNGFYS